LDGRFRQRSVSVLEVDVSFVWDYLQNPQVQCNGEIPQKSDFYLTVGLGVRF